MQLSGFVMHSLYAHHAYCAISQLATYISSADPTPKDTFSEPTDERTVL